VGISKDVVQDKYPALTPRQLSKRGSKRCGFFAPRIRHRWTLRESGICVFPSGAFAVPINRFIHHDAMEPRQGCGVAAEPMTRTKGTKKGILHHIFGFVSDVARGNRSQLPPRMFVQVYDRVFQGEPPAGPASAFAPGATADKKGGHYADLLCRLRFRSDDARDDC
jgi:hypothetical protein